MQQSDLDKLQLAAGEETEQDLALRFNEGKPRMSLLPVNALIEEVRLWEKGEIKYGRDNWKKLYGPDTVNQVMDSLLRHCMAILEGEVYDSETGCYHAAAIRCNAAILIEFYKKSEGV